MERKVTIREVAKEAGVAISTVSNALNGSDLVKEETREKIRAAAERLGYIPNMNGRILKGGRSRQLCFLTSSVKGEYFIRLIEAMNDACVHFGYGLHIYITWDTSAVMKQLLGRQFDGFFMFEGERVQEPEFRILQNERIPVVLLDRKYSSDCIGSVVFDSYQAGLAVTEYLVGLGHKRFCFADSTVDTYDAAERKRGFLQALASGGIQADSAQIIQGRFDEDITFSAVRALLAQCRQCHRLPPTAYVCGNDKSAIGAIKALKSEGIAVPENVSVAGFDDIELAQYYQPALTTVRNPIEQQGKAAVDMMIGMLEGRQTGQSVELRGAVVARNSTGISRD